MLAKSKLNSIEALVPQVLNDMEMSYEEFDNFTILREKYKYEKMEENVKSENE